MLDSLLSALVSLGLGHPMSRAVAFGALGFAYQVAARPSMSYIQGEEGYIAKPFVLTSDSPYRTYMPWWAWIAGPALLGGLFL